MSVFADERKTIEERLAANWTLTPIKFENAPFKETAAAYVACYVRRGEGQRISLGSNPLKRWVGVLVLQVYVPARTGTQMALEYADGLAALFDEAELAVGATGRIRFRVPGVTTSTSMMQGQAASEQARQGWLQVNVNVPYILDQRG